MPEAFRAADLFGDRRFPVIAGPCVIEGRDHALRMAEALARIARTIGLDLIYKSSYDKANRTSIQAYRGPGLDAGLAILADVRDQTGLPVLTDVHSPAEARSAAQVVDILQIPAFLCRQTDLLVAAAQTGKAVNVKKGQFLAPYKMRNVVDKLEASGCRDILLTERGTMFGYQQLVVDMTAIPIMQQTGYPVIFDGTHSAQVPGQPGDATGGQRQYIPTLVRAAVAAGCDGLFLEVHDQVKQARSDAATQWPLTELESLLRSVQALREGLR
ncbi:MAG: 3-deoxy-8-phosphooctulonate synthase [Candidatus Neomarinimicrobiota bacterium]|nr:MAG: 3-deoxy-8-phosphooctulonate synthase [Candidatus Neomarinimicrobiota bacterium]